jgi:predicted nicotinamide N-methyase
MAKLLVMATCPPPPPSSREPFIPRLVAPGVWGPVASWRERRVLELGCGCGLTGLVAGAVGARAVMLTDLKVVIEGITQRNLERNSHLGGNGGTKIYAMPLCWGNADDEALVARQLDRLAPPLLPNEKTGSGGRKKKKSKSKAGKRASDTSSRMESLSRPSTAPRTREGMPDIVLIGDVAYQHRPGSDSHFDILMSTVLRFTDSHTLVMFGTRARMAASADLLEMFREHFDEVIEPIQAHEIDKSFTSENLGRKHNISIHLLRRKKETEVDLSEEAAENPQVD